MLLPCQIHTRFSGNIVSKDNVYIGLQGAEIDPLPTFTIACCVMSIQILMFAVAFKLLKFKRFEQTVKFVGTFERAVKAVLNAFKCLAKNPGKVPFCKLTTTGMSFQNSTAIDCCGADLRRGLLNLIGSTR